MQTLIENLINGGFNFIATKTNFMKHTISPDRTRLTISVTDAERRILYELGEEINQDAIMVDYLEPLTCNSELEWLPEGATGDLTNAPMLGILGGQDRESYSDTQDRKSYTAAIVERWAFMDYQVRSVLEDLRDKGEAVFTGGPIS